MKTSWRSLLAQFLARSRAIGPGRQAIFTRKPPSKNLRFPGVALMSNRYNHHLAGRAKQQTRPAAAVFGRPGEFDAHSRWIRKLARSSARSTPREGAKRKKPGGRWSAATGRTPRESAKRQRTTRDTPSKGHSHSVHANPLSFAPNVSSSS